MYLKIAMHESSFKILEQDTREHLEITSSNGIAIKIMRCPELRGYERKLFLRGTDSDEDDDWLYYDCCEGVNFTNYLRALEEVVESFVVCLR